LIKPGNEIDSMNLTKGILKNKLFESSSLKIKEQKFMTKYFMEVIKYYTINYFIHIIFNMWSIFVEKSFIYLSEKLIHFSEPKSLKIRQSNVTQDEDVIVITKSKKLDIEINLKIISLKNINNYNNTILSSN